MRLGRMALFAKENCRLRTDQSLNRATAVLLHYPALICTDSGLVALFASPTRRVFVAILPLSSIILCDYTGIKVTRAMRPPIGCGYIGAWSASAVERPPIFLPVYI